MDEKPPAEQRRRDEAQLELLFRRHYRDVAAYVRRRASPDLVEDVVAETFLVAWRRLDEVPVDARPWLLGVARKTLATQRRSVARRRSLLTRLEAFPSQGEPDEQPTGLGVVEALMRLSETDREAITLVAWDGLSPSEAALVVGQSPVAFRVRLHRAKQRLRRRLAARQRAREGTWELAAHEVPLTRGGLKR
jgi:RNA polymerase sigma-70 factor (ECF subfamily)